MALSRDITVIKRIVPGIHEGRDEIVLQVPGIIIRHHLFRHEGTDVEIIVADTGLEEELGPLYVRSGDLLPEICEIDPEPVGTQAESIPVRVADAGQEIERHPPGGHVGICQVSRRTDSDLAGKVPGGSLQLVDSPSYVQEYGHDFLGVETHSHAHLADRPLLAVEPQTVRLGVAQQLVIDVVERIRTEDGGHCILYLRVAHPGPRIHPDLVVQVAAFLVTDPGYFHSGNHDLGIPDVIGWFILEAGGIRTDDLLERIQDHGIFQCRHISPVDYRVHTLSIEAEHSVFMEVRLDAYVRKVLVLLERRPSHHVDAGIDHVADIVDVGIALISTGQVDSYHDVRTAFLGQVGRIIVAHPTVDQHHSTHLHRRKEPRDGHGGPEGCVQLALGPDLGGSRHQVGRHAEERNRQILVEINLILVADRKGTEYVVDILPVNHSGRKAAQEVVPDKTGSIFLARAEVDLPGTVRILEFVFPLVHELVPVVEERERQDIFFLVLDGGI